MKEKILKKLWNMLNFRNVAPEGSNTYLLRNARLNGAISLAKELGFVVDFNPLAKDNENPFTIEERI